MDSFEVNTHVFIVRVWLEPRDNTMAAPEWRGVIEHVPTRQRQYFKNLASVADFIWPYLKQMGAQGGPRSRLRRWLKKIG